jgi:hypothetical protein
MTDVPPIIKPPVAPPPLPPTALSDTELQRCISRCKVICIVWGSVFVVGVCGFIVQYIEEGTANWGAFAFGVCYVVAAYTAAWLLHRRHPAGHTLAFLCMLVILLAIPAGTICGILGFIWLNKGRVILKK